MNFKFLHFKAGVWDFENKEVNTEEASFRDNESTRIYSDTAICSNIQHSLKCYQDGNHFRRTRRCVLYKGESGIASNGIEYKNIEEYLKELE